MPHCIRDFPASVSAELRESHLFLDPGEFDSLPSQWNYVIGCWLACQRTWNPGALSVNCLVAAQTRKQEAIKHTTRQRLVRASAGKFMRRLDQWMGWYRTGRPGEFREGGSVAWDTTGGRRARSG